MDGPPRSHASQAALIICQPFAEPRMWARPRLILGGERDKRRSRSQGPHIPAQTLVTRCSIRIRFGCFTQEPQQPFKQDCIVFPLLRTKEESRGRRSRGSSVKPGARVPCFLLRHPERAASWAKRAAYVPALTPTLHLAGRGNQGRRYAPPFTDRRNTSTFPSLART